MGRVMRNFAGYTVIGFIGLMVAGIALLGLGGVLYMVFSIWYAVFSFFGQHLKALNCVKSVKKDALL